MGGPNLAEHTFEEGRVRTREADWQWRTLYLGSKDKTATGEDEENKVTCAWAKTTRIFGQEPQDTPRGRL